MLNKRALNLKRKLANGQASPGLWVSMPSPTACEIIAGAGLDWIIVDAEHSPFNPETLQHMLMAFRGSETVPLVRVPWNDHVIIKQMLDLGFDGVVVPHTNAEEEARKAVAACRYPPAGRRGFGPRRASNYYRDQEEYVKLANDSVICAIQIEDVAAADRIEEIIQVPGVDWVLVGPWDMSGTTLNFGAIESDEVQGAIRRIFQVAQAAGLPTGNAYCGIDHIEKALDQGCQLVVLGEDADYLKHSVDGAVEAFRKAIKDREK